MQAKKARIKNPLELLDELDLLMKSKEYREVDRLLTRNPDLINGLTARCEVPLVMAIKEWDPRLVELCMKHGANPEEQHLCSKDRNRPKIPKLIVGEEFLKRIKNKSDAVFKKNNAIYTAILRALVCDSPFPEGAK